jgi:hypothetical protein
MGSESVGRVCHRRIHWRAKPKKGPGFLRASWFWIGPKNYALAKFLATKSQLMRLSMKAVT